jgi:hypothetical protein
MRERERERERERQREKQDGHQCKLLVMVDVSLIKNITKPCVSREEGGEKRRERGKETIYVRELRRCAKSRVVMQDTPDKAI